MQKCKYDDAIQLSEDATIVGEYPFVLVAAAKF